MDRVDRQRGRIDRQMARQMEIQVDRCGDKWAYTQMGRQIDKYIDGDTGQIDRQIARQMDKIWVYRCEDKWVDRIDKGVDRWCKRIDEST